MVCPSTIHDLESVVISSVVEQTVNSATGHPGCEVAVSRHAAVGFG